MITEEQQLQKMRRKILKNSYDSSQDEDFKLYNLNGDENLTSYSENGLSETYAKAGISQDLLNELPPPEAGVIK